MSFFAIQNFRFGLDTRRSEYTSQPGTLLTLNNCHINEGGEIEKRQAFSQATGLINTFGLVAGASGLYVFGSIATPGGFPLTLFGVVVTYIRCQHPDGATAMTAVASATTFAGLPFCIATFTDGNSYCYYNGAFISDFTAGLIIASLNTNAKIGAAFATLVNASGQYTATNVGGGVVDVFNPANAQATGFTDSIVETSAAGTVIGNFTADGTPAVVQGAAMAQFEIHAGTAVPAANVISSVKVFGLPTTTVSRSRTGTTVTLVVVSTAGMTTTDKATISGLSDVTFNIANTAITVVDMTHLTYTVATTGTVASTPDTGGTVMDLTVGVEILSVAVNWQTDNAHTSEAVAAQINAFSSTPDYVADSSGGVVTIFTTAANAAAFNGLILQVTVGGNVCVGDCVFSVTPNAGYTANTNPFANIYVNGIDINDPSGITAADLPTAIADVVAYINSQTASPPGILAWSSYSPTGGNIMRLSKAITRSDDSPIAINIKPTTGYGVSTGSSAPLQCTLNQTSIAGGIIVTAVASGSVTGVTATGAGGVPFNYGYNHSWSGTSNGQFITSKGTIIQGSISILNGTTATPTFTTTGIVGTLTSANIIGTFTDTITDAAGNVVTSGPVIVSFTF